MCLCVTFFHNGSGKVRLFIISFSRLNKAILAKEGDKLIKKEKKTNKKTFNKTVELVELMNFLLYTNNVTLGIFPPDLIEQSFIIIISVHCCCL